MQQSIDEFFRIDPNSRTSASQSPCSYVAENRLAGVDRHDKNRYRHSRSACILIQEPRFATFLDVIALQWHLVATADIEHLPREPPCLFRS